MIRALKEVRDVSLEDIQAERTASAEALRPGWVLRISKVVSIPGVE